MAIVEIKTNSEEDIDEARKKLILAERERHLLGISKSYSWDEVRNMAIKKEIQPKQ